MNHNAVLESLRAHIAAVEGVGFRSGSIAFGVGAIDRHLPAKGIANGALHELAGSPELADDAAATVFLGGILARTEGTVIWCLRWRELFAPGLYLAGLHPDRVIFLEAGDDKGVLIAMEEALRHEGLAGVVGELRTLPPIASKRLQLAAEKSGVPAFAFRRWSKPVAQPSGSAAVTRWRIRAAPSEALGIASLGIARWRVELERARGAEPKSWIVEACDAQGRIALPAELADRPASAEERQVAA